MSNLNNLPDIEFVSADIHALLEDIVSGYEKAHLEQTGKPIKLYPGDPLRIFLYSQALREFQLRKLIDHSAKQTLLKYAKGSYLDHIGANKGIQVSRLPASPATAQYRFTLSTAQTSVYTIPKGIRVSAGGDLYFETTEVLEIPSGDMSIETEVKCQTSGAIGNGFLPGQINVIVDPLPFLAKGENLTTSEGGSDIEDDERYRERIHLSPEGYSTAGPGEAYIYFAKSYSPLIKDVKANSPNDGEVDIRILLENGEIPSTTFLENIYDYLNDKKKRPLTDKLSVNAPETVTYNIDVDYYILDDNAASVPTIQNKVQEAINEYIVWQKSKIGRDINPSELIGRMIQAGAKRVELREPLFTSVQAIGVAVENTVSVQYGGMEDD